MTFSLKRFALLVLPALLASSASAAPLTKRADGACVIKLPPNALSATGLSTPWIVSGAGCTQNPNGMPTFAECSVVDTATGKVSVYSPLLINQGQQFVKPVVPTLTATSVVGCWFGTNGVTTTLTDGTNGKDLAAAKCVNGSPGVKGDIFGQFAACNGAAFFAAANTAGVQVPALGTGKNGKACYTTRSFELIDMDQSDNVITTYSLDKNNKIGQKTTANSKTLTIDINNGSDNLLLDLFMRPALGCTAFMAPSLADPAMMVGSLALNELQAAAGQQAPIALVPPNDPMVLTTNGAKMSAAKQNAYRAAVNMGPGTGATPEALTYCNNYLAVGAPSIITDAKFTMGFLTPDAANGKDLYTFLGQRFAASWAGLGCDALVKNIVYLNPKQMLPIIANRDGNGVTQSLTFNTAALVALAKQNGVPNGAAVAATTAKATKAMTTAKAAANAKTTKAAAAMNAKTTAAAAAGGTAAKTTKAKKAKTTKAAAAPAAATKTAAVVGQGATQTLPPCVPAPAAGGQAATAPAPAAPAPAPSTAGAPTYVMTLHATNCWGTGPVNFGVNTQISVNGVAPADDMNGGLASLHLTFNDLADIGISSTWNMGIPTTSGNVLMFETENDQPGPGGIFTTNSATCENGVMSPAIMSVTLTGQLLSGVAINPSVTVGN
ncbi:hypothetical protein M427DRAFT_66035 [Gonapodya prolifera JEL478]|uniref:Uncharacterized protein n=1 Tax=Gonapodya prolifera (strain JEL478) TaxID=1344416 RepID=A0A139AX38_GONPJ|nr:hypothetical protein M427DRAFT_66035 [Gonapodya prolifera JEL478]|eukprot:KXS21288.1 hypothetical protein M427DRAFT_66035 [Gonapodya prolifera JEL478]